MAKVNFEKRKEPFTIREKITSEFGENDVIRFDVKF